MKKALTVVSLVTILLSTLPFSVTSLAGYMDENQFEPGYYCMESGYHNGFSYYVYSHSSVRLKEEISADNSFVSVYNYDNNNNRVIAEFPEVTIPSEINGLPVKYIEATEDWYDEHWLAKGIIIPDSIVAVGENAFNKEPFVEIIKISSSVEYIGESAFAETQGVYIPEDNNLHYIGNYAFSESTIKNKKLVLGRNLTFIGKAAFKKCTNFEELEFLSKELEVDFWSFHDCSDLKKVSAPNLETYLVEDDDLGFKNTPFFDNANTIIFGKIFMMQKNREATSVVIPEGIITIHDYAFSHSKIQEITLPSTMKEIKDGAFLSCTVLKKIVFNDGLEHIGKYAFSRCISLEELNIPDSVEELGYCSFEYCKNLGKLKLPRELVTIPEGCFKDCFALNDLEIPESVTSVEDRAFAGCTFNEITLINQNIALGKEAIGYLYDRTVKDGVWETEYYKLNPDFCINCYEGSSAENYAANNGFSFIILDNKGIGTNMDQSVSDNGGTFVEVKNKDSVNEKKIAGIISGIIVLIVGMVCFILFKKKLDSKKIIIVVFITVIGLLILSISICLQSNDYSTDEINPEVSNGTSSLDELEMILENNSFFTEEQVGSMSIAMKYWTLEEYGVTDYSNIENNDIAQLAIQLNETWFGYEDASSFRLIIGDKYPVKVEEYVSVYEDAADAFGGNFSEELRKELDKTEEVWIADVKRVHDTGQVYEAEADTSLEMTFLFLKISGEYYWCYIEMW